MSAVTYDRPTSPMAVSAPAAAGWEPATRREMAALIVYFILLLAVSDIANLRLGVEYMTLLILPPVFLITRRPQQFFRDWWFLLVGLLLWNLSGYVAAQSPFPPHWNLMIRVDGFLGFGHDPVAEVQNYLASGTKVNVLDILTSVAYNVHVPEPYIAGYLLWRINRQVYFLFASSVLILFVAGFVTFELFPAAPPWVASEWWHLIPPGVTNRFGPTLALHPLPFHGSPLYDLTHWPGDPIAAFPSEHAAVPFLEMLAFGLCLGRRAYFALGIWVLWVLFTIVYLGEHWITDALAGYVYAIVIFLAVRWWMSRREQTRHPLRNEPDQASAGAAL